MGASGSTRRVTIENADGAGVVKISENVVRRLKGQPDLMEPTKDTEAPKISSNVSRTEPSKESSSRQVTNIDEALLYKTRVEEFSKAVQEVEQKFLRHTGSPVCQELQQSVYDCYQDNPNKSLNCSSYVKAFTACVQKARQNASMRQG